MAALAHSKGLLQVAAAAEQAAAATGQPSPHLLDYLRALATTAFVGTEGEAQGVLIRECGHLLPAVIDDYCRGHSLDDRPALRIMQRAADEAGRRRSAVVSANHLLIAICETGSPEVADVFKRTGGDAFYIARCMKVSTGRGLRTEEYILDPWAARPTRDDLHHAPLLLRDVIELIEALSDNEWQRTDWVQAAHGRRPRDSDELFEFVLSEFWPLR